MDKQIRYYVIGGQYEYCCYGGTPTLIGAKRLATRCTEYWDNWQGWHKPSIYRAEDTVEIVSHGMITVPDGQKIRIPVSGARPI